MKFPIELPKSRKPDLNIWHMLRYVPVINATQVWLIINPILFTQNGVFSSCYDHQYYYIQAVWGFATIKCSTKSDNSEVGGSVEYLNLFSNHFKNLLAYVLFTDQCIDS